MSTDAPRVAALRRMLETRPDDTRIRFALALEYEKLERWEDAVTELRTYLDAAEDEGNAWGRLANGLRRLDRHEEARDAYRTGIQTANRHGHPTMASEFEELLAEMEEEAGSRE